MRAILFPLILSIKLILKDNIVFVSEYTYPSDFDYAYRFEFTRGVRSKAEDGEVKNEKVTENLVVHKSLIENGLVIPSPEQLTLF